MQTAALLHPSIPQAAGLSTPKVNANSEVIRAALLSTCYFFVADLGLITAMDGVIFALAASLVFPVWRPYILLLVLSIHDAPGQADPYLYHAVCGIGAMMLASALIVRVKEQPRFTASYFRLACTAVAVIGYGVLNSFWQHRLGLHEQAADRSYILVGTLTALMIIVGLIANTAIERDPRSETRLQTICLFVVGHIILIAVLQLFLGPQFCASDGGARTIVELEELLHGRERGIARLTGPFLSPNTLAMLPAFYLLVLLRKSRGQQISDSFIATFILVGFAVSLLGGARSMFAFYLVGAGALMWTKSPARAVGFGLLGLPLIFVVGIPWDELMQVMRFKNLGALGTRGEFWAVAFHNLTTTDWMFGFGMSHWPVFFEHYTGKTTSDPHNWILSMAGNYGIAGLSFYLILGWLLVKRCLAGPSKYRAIAVCLLVMFFGRDLANTQYVINNHPISCLYWIAIGSVFLHPSNSSHSGLTHNRFSTASLPTQPVGSRPR
jgi:hypothetical protein